MSIGAAMTILAHIMRPFVMKYASSRAMLVISIISFLAHVGPAFALIPKWNLMGAAYAYSIGCCAVGMSWLFFFMDRFLFRPQRYAFSSSIDNIDAEAVESSPVD
ncbi:MAG: hypothetical protein GXY44_08195 [Phycisphaerales bacterium]|nr:hypothetical protein [Phycisphaerales bacterium]